MRQRRQQARRMRNVSTMNKAQWGPRSKIPRRRSVKRRSLSKSLDFPSRSAKATGISGDSRIAAHIRAFGIGVSQDTRTHLRRKVDRRLGKFADSIERVSIRLRDVNGPRGGVDQACRIKVVLKNLPSVVFENQDVSLAGAFSGALTGAGRKVRRSLQRRRSKPIKKSPAPLLD